MILDVKREKKNQRQHPTFFPVHIQDISEGLKFHNTVIALGHFRI